ncbi:MAG: hypothetical protein K0S47_4324 [Herbinix sp.]|nr:hypothetical protein [Herbinix sp.]
MNDNTSLINWLMEYGGPTIRLITLTELLNSGDKNEIQKCIDELLTIDKVKKNLEYINGFNHYKSMSEHELSSLIHNCGDSYYTIFMNELINYGFKAGMEIFDENTKILREVCAYTSEDMPYSSMQMSMFLSYTGYECKEIESYLFERARLCQSAATRKVSEIYVTGEEYEKLPKWIKDKNIKVIKDEFSPYGGESPLPLEYEVRNFLYMNRNNISEIDQEKIDNVFKYIISPEYYSINGDYGFHKAGKTYHGSNCGFVIPIYEDGGIEKVNVYFFLSTVRDMSFSKIMRDSSAYKKCLSHIDSFKTENGTYIFPQNYLSHMAFSHPSDLYNMLLKNSIQLKRDEKKRLAIELFSTLFVLILQKRAELHD